MKPVIFYIDDEPHNLTVFEACLPEEWDVRTYDSPLAAINDLEELQPYVVVCDQRMPNMNGVALLEIVKKVTPHAIRIIVTGYSDEDLVVESVRKAQVFDYIRKPWEPTELEISIKKAVDHFVSEHAARKLQAELVVREQELIEKTEKLMKMTTELEESNKRERSLREELQCWVPPFVLQAVQRSDIVFPVKKDIVGITFDIIGSSNVHEIYIGNRSIRSVVITLFSELIIKYGGWRESHTGDSAYGHFGLFNENLNPSESALAAAREFRTNLRSIYEIHGIELECGIALHKINNAVVDVHSVQLSTPDGIIKQKSFDTTSIEIDKLHRIEKLAHKLPGTNILLSKEFKDSLKVSPLGLLDLGQYEFKGQKEPVDILIIKSDKISQLELSEIKAKLAA